MIFSDNTSVIFSSKKFDEFCIMSNVVLSCMSRWFATNRLACPSVDETNTTVLQQMMNALNVG
jgi:hypothetical protein